MELVRCIKLLLSLKVGRAAGKLSCEMVQLKRWVEWRFIHEAEPPNVAVEGVRSCECCNFPPNQSGNEEKENSHHFVTLPQTLQIKSPVPFFHVFLEMSTNFRISVVDALSWFSVLKLVFSPFFFFLFDKTFEDVLKDLSEFNQDEQVDHEHCGPRFRVREVPKSKMGTMGT